MPVKQFIIIDAQRLSSSKTVITFAGNLSMIVEGAAEVGDIFEVECCACGLPLERPLIRNVIAQDKPWVQCPKCNGNYNPVLVAGCPQCD